MLGFGPPGSRPVAGTPLPLEDLAATATVYASALSFGAPQQDVALRIARTLSADVLSFSVTIEEATFVTSVSQVLFSRISLVGTTSTRISEEELIQDFRMTAGDTKLLLFTVKDSNGDRVNISGSTIAWKCSRSYRKTAALSKATGGSGISITDGANGEFTVTLDPGDTDDLYGDYYHEAQLTGSDGTISTLVRGTMRVERALITA